MISTFPDWFRTFDRTTKKGNTVGVAPELVAAAYESKFIKTTGIAHEVMLTTRGVRSQLHDKRIMLSSIERQTLRAALQSYHIAHADKLPKLALLALIEKLL